MKTHILIADDEANMRLGLKDNLEFEGYQISEASDGEEALEMVQHLKPDLILLDIMMPKMSGFDVCKKLSAINKLYIMILMCCSENPI